MSAICSTPGCTTCGLVHVQRAEVRDGRRYVNGVDVGPAQPDAFGVHTNAKRGAPVRKHRSRR